ncbi:hypothetical protein VW29_09360, partial [Devosia limi DSM 17137]
MSRRRSSWWVSPELKRRVRTWQRGESENASAAWPSVPPSSGGMGEGGSGIGRESGRVAAAQESAPALVGQAGSECEKVGLASPRDPGNDTDLAGPHRKADILDPQNAHVVGNDEVLRCQHGRAGIGRPLLHAQQQ